MSIDSFFQPLLQLANPPIPEKEMAVVAFNKIALIVYTNNGFLQQEFDVEEISSQLNDEDAPDHGIWIWEGHKKINKSNSDSPFYDWEYDVEFITDLWRQPTEKEWKAISEQRNPFEDEILG
jgi:hypothetical protein